MNVKILCGQCKRQLEARAWACHTNKSFVYELFICSYCKEEAYKKGYDDGYLDSENEHEWESEKDLGET